MSKRMAKINSNNIVINILNCSDFEKNNTYLKDTEDYLVNIGDYYHNGEWFRKNEKVLTSLDISQNEIQRLEEQKNKNNFNQKNSYLQGVNSI